MRAHIARKFLTAAALAVTLGLSTTAHGYTIDLTAYNAVADGLSLSVDVTVNGGNASFVFANHSTGDSSAAVMSRIYFEAGFGALGLSGGTVIGGAGTSFDTSYPGPESPPGGNTVNWAGELAAFGAGSPPPVNGVNVGETLQIDFVYGGTLDALVSGMLDPNGNARIATHVQNCINGNSCAAHTVVPVPAALPLLLSGLAGLGMFFRKK